MSWTSWLSSLPSFFHRSRPSKPEEKEAEVVPLMPAYSETTETGEIIYSDDGDALYEAKSAEERKKYDRIYAALLKAGIVITDKRFWFLVALAWQIAPAAAEMCELPLGSSLNGWGDCLGLFPQYPFPGQFDGYTTAAFNGGVGRLFTMLKEGVVPPAVVESFFSALAAQTGWKAETVPTNANFYSVLAELFARSPAECQTQVLPQTLGAICLLLPTNTYLPQTTANQVLDSLLPDLRTAAGNISAAFSSSMSPLGPSDNPLVLYILLGTLLGGGLSIIGLGFLILYLCKKYQRRHPAQTTDAEDVEGGAALNERTPLIPTNAASATTASQEKKPVVEKTFDIPRNYNLPLDPDKEKEPAFYELLGMSIPPIGALNAAAKYLKLHGIDLEDLTNATTTPPHLSEFCTEIASFKDPISLSAISSWPVVLKPTTTTTKDIQAKPSYTVDANTWANGFKHLSSIKIPATGETTDDKIYYVKEVSERYRHLMWRLVRADLKYRNGLLAQQKSESTDETEKENLTKEIEKKEGMIIALTLCISEYKAQHPENRSAAPDDSAAAASSSGGPPVATPR